MHAVFDSRPVSLLDGAAVVATGIALLLIVEVEKRVIAFASRGKPTVQTR